MFNYRSVATAVALTVSSLTSCRSEKPDAQRFAALNKVEAAQSLRDLNTSEARTFAGALMALDDVPLNEGARGTKVSAINKMLEIKGFQILDSAVLSKDAIEALKLINTAIGHKNTAALEAETLAALAALPNSQAFSLFSLASHPTKSVDQSLQSAPHSVLLDDRSVSFRQALQLATPVFDDVRRGNPLAWSELDERSKRSDHYQAARELLKIALNQASRHFSSQSSHGALDIGSRLQSSALDSKALATCEGHFPALMADWQSWSGGGASIKTIYLVLTREARAHDSIIEYSTPLHEALSRHFGKPTASIENNTEHLFKAFF